MEILELMKQRHSVRQYKDIAIGPEQRIALNHLIEEINGEAGLHIQIFYDEPQCFDSMMAHYGKFSGVKNYIALVGKKSPKLGILWRKYCCDRTGARAQQLLGGNDSWQKPSGCSQGRKANMPDRVWSW